MSNWKIKEVMVGSLNELNTYIKENNIAPSDVLRYDTVFDHIKQSVRYTLTYWTIKD